MVKTKVINGKHNKSFLSFEKPSCKYYGVKDCVKYKMLMAHIAHLRNQFK